MKREIDEVLMYGEIKDLVLAGIHELRTKLEPFEFADLAALEKYTKIYCMLKDDLREDTKSGLWDKLKALDLV